MTYIKYIYYKLFRKIKVTILIFVDSDSCICNYYKEIISKIDIVDIIQVKTLQNIECNKLIDCIDLNSNIMVFAHGDKDKLQYFFNKKENSKEYKKYIDQKWWSRFDNKSLNAIYFHACYGAKILSKDKKLSDLFENWIAYDSKLISVISYNEYLIKINREFIYQVIIAVKDKKSLDSLCTSIKRAYFELGINLYDKGKMVDGFSSYFACIGSNIKSLKHSQMK